MREQQHLRLMGHILLMTLMFSGMLELSVVAHASTLPQDTALVSISTVKACNAIDGSVAYADGIASWRQQQAILFAKYPKAKSTLPYLQWVPSITPPASALSPHADVPLAVFAETYCYAIHPRPPTTLTA